MEYGNFYDIAEYGNANWKGNFTPKEIACNAYDYLVEFEESKARETVTPVIQELCKLLAEDVEERAVKENPFQFDRIKGYAAGIYNALEFVKNGGKEE